MGCFDSVVSKCECGGEIEWQSKAGECLLRRYTLRSIPLAIASSIQGTSSICDKCGKEVFISMYGGPISTVAMFTMPAEELEEDESLIFEVGEEDD